MMTHKEDIIFIVIVIVISIIFTGTFVISMNFIAIIIDTVIITNTTALPLISL